MTSIFLQLSEDQNWALKAWSVKHGYTDKTKAVAYMIEWWLKEKGFLSDTLEEQLFDEGYENV